MPFTIVMVVGAFLCPALQAVDVVVSNEFGHCVLVYASSASFLKRTIDSAFDSPIGVREGDIDGDGRVDVVAVSSGVWSGNDGHVSWWQNLGSGTGWTARVIAAGLNYAWDVRVADVDRDGDLDAVGALWKADDVVWWENDGGSGTNWVPHTIDADFDGAAAVDVVDVNGDGHRDIIGVAYHGDDVAWWENGGTNATWTKRIIDSSFAGPFGLAAADVDSDGDVDIVAASFDGDRVAWWENLGGGTNWHARTVETGFRGAYGVQLADVDGDGYVDIVGTANVSGGGYDDLVWWKNQDGLGRIWERHRVTAGFDVIKGSAVRDMDRDGDIDLVTSSTFLNDAVWWENLDGRGLFWRRHALDYNFVGARTVAAADVSGDGELDVIAGADSSTTIAWWENPITNRIVFLPPVDTQTVATTIGSRLVITNTPFQIGATQYMCSGWTGTGDVPPRGGLPIIEIPALSNDTTVAWSWRRRYALKAGVISNGTIDRQSGWYDEDAAVTIAATPAYLHVFRAWTGDVSVAQSALNPVTLIMDRPRSVTAVFAEVDHVITATAGAHGTVSPAGTIGVSDGDDALYTFFPDPHYHVDQLRVDGVPVAFVGQEYTFMDVISNHTIDVTFALNAYALTVKSEYGETHLAFGPWMTFDMRIVDGFVEYPRQLHAANIDGDDHMDIIGIADTANPVAWWRNEGAGTNWSHQGLCTNVTDATIILPGDFDNNDTMDLAAVRGTNGLYWFNHPAGGSNYVAHAISVNGPAITAITAFDANSDQTRDIFAVCRESDTILWWWNEAAEERWYPYVIATNFSGPAAIASGDIDGDTFTDFAVASPDTGQIAWWRNSRGDGSLWIKRSVSALAGVNNIVIADMDTDGDMDILGASGSDAKILWWENTDLVGGSWRSHLVESYIPNVVSLTGIDFDRDGDVDVVAADPGSHAVRWWDNAEGDGLSWTPRVLNSSFYNISSAVIADFNSDGELDCAASAPGISYVGWLENQTTGKVVLTPPSATVVYPYGTEIRGFHTQPVRRNGDVQRALTGWLGSGSIPRNGTDRAFGPLTLAADSTLDWLWDTRYWVQLNANSNGMTSPVTGWFSEGTNLFVRAQGSTAHAFAGWTGDLERSARVNNPLSLLIDAPKSVTAHFAEGDYGILAEFGPGGTIDPAGAIGVQAGSARMFTLVPDAGHVVSGIFVDSQALSPRESYTFSAISSNHVIEALFEQETAQTDTDGDGLANVDEGRFGLDKYDADTDDDGFNDYGEAVAGTDGTNAQSVFIVRIDSLATQGEVAVSWQSATGRVYTLWSRIDLTAGSWQTVDGQTNVPGTGAIMVYTNALPDPVRHFRPEVRFAP